MMDGVISEALVLLDCGGGDREGVCRLLAEAMFNQGRVSDVEVFCRDVAEREAVMSTHCGGNLAIPHGISAAVKQPTLAFARTRTPIVWHVEEHEYASLIFLLAIPVLAGGGNSRHIEIMSQVATLCMEDGLRSSWERATSAREVLESLSGVLQGREVG